MKTTNTTGRAITNAINLGLAAGLHKGDLQDLVCAAVGAITGRRGGQTYLTLEEGALAHQTLVRLGGANINTGFKPDQGVAYMTTYSLLLQSPIKANRAAKAA